MYPAIAATAAVLLLVAGCGGGGKKAPASATVAGPGFTFATPVGWRATVAASQASAVPPEGGETLVSVSVFRLVKPYRSELWPKVVPELDRVTAELAGRLRAKLDASRTVTVSAEQARQYDLSFSHGGKDVRERITFLLLGRQEYELLCRWAAGTSEPAACAGLLASFTPA